MLLSEPLGSSSLSCVCPLLDWRQFGDLEQHCPWTAGLQTGEPQVCSVAPERTEPESARSVCPVGEASQRKQPSVLLSCSCGRAHFQRHLESSDSG